MTIFNHGSDNEPRYDVVWPLSRRAVTATNAAPRLPDLNGRTICELWDFYFRGEVIFPLVRESVKARYPNARFIEYSEFGNVYGRDEHRVIAGLADALRSRGCDAVIVGIGA